ncbi:MAG: hypothetical protein JWL80_336 [Parcubacteria group bacterium]|nr:hypothetical protein [Parcubacteria group bacterium]
MDLKSTYNKIAEDWFQDHKEDIWWKTGADKFTSFLSPGVSILDVGCGAGIKSKYLADKGFKVIGTDFSEGMIEVAKREVPNVEFFVKDIYEPNSLDQTFDAVFAQAVLLHIPKERIMDVLKNLRDTLNQDGLIYLGVKEMKDNQVNNEILKENDYGYEYERFFSYFTLDEMKGYLESHNMEILWTNISKAGNTNWVEVIAKKF